MKMPIRISGLMVFIAIIALFSAIYLIFANHFIASGLRTTGSELIGAKVDLGSADLSLGSQSLSLEQLAVTNPKSAMNNLFEVEKLALDIDASALAWNKVVIDKIEISELLLNTPRATSGAMDRQWTNVQEWAPFENIQDLSAIGADKLPDPKQLVAAADLQTIRAIDDFKAQLKETETELSSQYEQLPSKEIIDQYQARLKQVLDKSGGGNKLLGMLSKGKDFKALRKDIKTDLNKIKRFKTELKSAQEQLGSQFKTLKNMPKQDLARLKSQYSLSGDGVSNLVSTVFGPQIGQWTQQGYRYYQYLMPIIDQYQSSDNSEVQESQFLTERGRRILFQDNVPLPNYLVKHIKISSANSGEHISIDGVVNNLTTEPNRWNEPLTLDLSGKAKFLNSFNLSATLDHRNQAQSKDEIRLNAAGLKLSDFADLAADSPIKPSAGLVDIIASVNVIQEQLDGKVSLVFQKAEFQIEQPDKWLSLIKTGLSGLETFKIEVHITGSMQDPSIKVSSPDLNKLSQQVIKSLMSTELKGFEDKLMAEIKQSTDGPLSNLPSMDLLSQLQTKLNLKELDLNKILKKAN